MFNRYIRKLRLTKIKKNIEKWSFEIIFDLKQNKQNEINKKKLKNLVEKKIT